MQYRAVIFDLDGTLLNTLADLANSVNQVLNKQGFPSHPIDDYRQYIGGGVGNLFRRALPGGEQAGHSDELIQHCVAGFQKVYGERWNVDSAPYDGTEAMLDELVDHTFKLAVLSNKPHDFTRQCVEFYFAKWPFEIVYGQRNGIPRKPDPQVPIDMARQLGYEASECIFVGDSDVDIETGLNANMLAVGVAWGFRGAAELHSAGAHHVISHPRDLIGVAKRS